MMEPLDQEEKEPAPQPPKEEEPQKKPLRVKAFGVEIEGATSLVVVILLVMLAEAVMFYYAVFELKQPRSFIAVLLNDSIAGTLTAMPTKPPAPTYTPAPPVTVEVIVTVPVEVTRTVEVEKTVVHTQEVTRIVPQVMTPTALPAPANLEQGIQTAFTCAAAVMDRSSSELCPQWLRKDEIESDIRFLKRNFSRIDSAEWKIDSIGENFKDEGRDFYTFDNMQSTLTITGSYICGGVRLPPETIKLKYKTLVRANFDLYDRVRIIYWEKKDPTKFFLCPTPTP